MPENDELKKYLDYDGLDYLIKRIPRTRIIVTFDDVFAGETATCSLGTTTYTNTVPVTEPYQLVFSVVELGTWTIATSYLGDDYGTTVEVTGVGTTATGHVSHVMDIDGETVEPTDDITKWLKCANIENPSITTLADVLANRSLFETLIANSNACKYMARSTSWIGNYSAKVPTMTGTTTPSGEVIAINQYSGATYYPWHVFDGNSSTIWCPASSGPGQWIGYIFPEKQTIFKFRLAYDSGRPVQSVIVQASDDGTTWTDLDTITTSASSDAEYSFNNTNSYYRYRLVFNMAAGIIATISIIQFYGGVQGVTTSRDTMSLIGKYDYCSNALLNNATWAEAITNSDYIDEVLNVKVPVMTSNTTPSGVASASSVYNNLAQYQAWKAFNGTNADSNDTWASAMDSSTNSYLQYQFAESNVISMIRWENRNTSTVGTVCSPKTYKIQGYNGSEWIDLTEELTNSDNTSSAKHTVWVTKNKASYQYYRMFIINAWTSGNDTYCCVAEFQLYGRKSSEVLIPLVPTMTSDTTPSGVVYANSELNNDYVAWKAFNGAVGTTNDVNRWVSQMMAYGVNVYLSYDFGKQVSTNKIKIYAVRSGSAEHPLASVIHIEGSNDNTIWNSITTKSMTAVEMSQYTDINYDTVNYRYYRVYFESCNIQGSGNDYYSQVAYLQFYQRQVQTNIIHSAANDTIYMIENGSQVPLCTTNSDGNGILDFTQFMDGTYTLYSSVAKDPNNLSNDFSKSMRITKTSYGCTTEAYLMPDTVKTLYWWGYDSGELEDMSTANGWTAPSGYSFGVPTRNTNNIYCNSSSGNYVNGVSSKTKHSLSKIIAIAEGKTKYAQTDCGEVQCRNSKTYSDCTYLGITTKDVIDKWEIAASNVGQYMASLASSGSRASMLYALWYE